MLIKTLFLIAPLLVAVAAVPEPDNRDGAAVVDRGFDSLDAEYAKRDDCDYNGCKCLKNHEGVWCAQCKDGSKFVVSELGKGGLNNIDHVFQCNKNGNCCSFGYAKKCKDGKAGRCGT